MNSEEWRPVPGFPGYEVTESGRLHHKYIGDIRELPDRTIMLQRGGRRYHRSLDKLVREAFYDRSQPVVDSPGYRAIPSAPGYSMHRRTKEVYNERLRIFLRRNINTDSVVLAINGKQVKRTIRSLYRETFE